MAARNTRQSFIKAALSFAGQPSSKRVLAAFALLVAVLIIPLDLHIDDDKMPFIDYFDGLLIFAAACLGGTVIETFKPNK